MNGKIFTLRNLYQSGTEKLEKAGIREAKLDAWYLLEYKTGISRAVFLADPDREVEEEKAESYQKDICTRARRIPLQHITGEQEFMGLNFKVNENVLVPRQDTEILVEEALKRIRPDMQILDMCTGSGCILESILKFGEKKQMHLKGTGCDISEEALKVARENNSRLGTDARFIKSDLFESVTEKYDMIVSNPPYSIKWAGDENPLLINDPRFAPAGVLAPKSKADMAFIMHSLSWLASNGTAAIVCFPGIMYRGGAEQKIRKYLVDNNYIDCIIQLPSNLFFGTSIATCIMVMKKNKTDNKTLFIDATSECVKVTNNNKLTPENIDRIVDVFAKREEMEHFAHLASYEEVSGNDYNLSVSTYVEAEDTREKIDIVKLNAEIKEIVAREQVLRDEIDKIIAEIEVNS